MQHHFGMGLYAEFLSRDQRSSNILRCFPVCFWVCGMKASDEAQLGITVKEKDAEGLKTGGLIKKRVDFEMNQEYH